MVVDCSSRTSDDTSFGFYVVQVNHLAASPIICDRSINHHLFSVMLITIITLQHRTPKNQRIRAMFDSIQKRFSRAHDTWSTCFVTLHSSIFDRARYLGQQSVPWRDAFIFWFPFIHEGYFGFFAKRTAPCHYW